jgi:hypothetical protein
MEELDEMPPARRCEVCRGQMVYLSTLPAFGRFQLQHVYKCSGCKFAMADTIKHTGSGE